MGLENLRERLRDVCVRYTGRPRPTGSKNYPVTVAEPYIPHLPDGWGGSNNGVLILAEAQNHGDANYLKWLQGLPPTHRIDRLCLHKEYPNKIGIQPWADRTLKLAAEAALGVRAEQVAVSNAVLWSRIDSDGNNMRPNRQLIELSASVWAEMLPILGQRLHHIVTAGAVPKQVMKTAGLGPHRLTAWCSPSPRVLSPLSAFVCVDDLKTRFPQVATALQAHPDWGNGIDRRKILYACLAVSATGR